MSPTQDTPPQQGELILYRTANDAIRVEVLYESDTFWLDQKRIAELFGVELPTISYHLKEIYGSGELSREATLRRILRVQTEGAREVRREIEFYNLDAIISVGYRVNSAQATQFRIWAPPNRNRREAEILAEPIRMRSARRSRASFKICPRAWPKRTLPSACKPLSFSICTAR